MDAKMLAPYDKTYIETAMRKIPEKYKLLKEYKNIVDSYEPEILQDYDRAMRCNLLTYILKDPAEKERLVIASIPAEYPVNVIRAPIPWHTPKVLSEQTLSRYYFNGHSAILRIRDLWEDE